MKRHTIFPLVLMLFSLSSISMAKAADDPIAIIVNKANPKTGILSTELKRIYNGRTKKWPNGNKMVIINRPIDSEIRARFYRTILDAKPTKKFFKSKSPLTFKVMQLKSGLATRKFVAHIPNAIGFIYLSEVDETVKVLKIDDLMPKDEDYVLK
ncbi:MAG: substrate-binding domain-containing protein [Nitrospiria bacterium]